MKLFKFVVLGLVFSLGLVGCFGPKNKDKDSASHMTEVAYGISIPLPDDFEVKSIVKPTDMSNQEIEEKIEKGDKVLLLAAQKVDDSNKPVANILVFAVNSLDYYMDETLMATLSKAELDKISAYIMDEDEKAAKRANMERQTIRWDALRDQIDGKLSFIQKGLGRHENGTGVVQLYDVYVKPPVGITFQLNGESTVPNIEQTFEKIVENVKFKNR